MINHISYMRMLINTRTFSQKYVPSNMPQKLFIYPPHTRCKIWEQLNEKILGKVLSFFVMFEMVLHADSIYEPDEKGR